MASNCRSIECSQVKMIDVYCFPPTHWEIHQYNSIKSEEEDRNCLIILKYEVNDERINQESNSSPQYKMCMCPCERHSVTQLNSV